MSPWGRVTRLRKRSIDQPPEMNQGWGKEFIRRAMERRSAKVGMPRLSSLGVLARLATGATIAGRGRLIVLRGRKLGENFLKFGAGGLDFRFGGIGDIF